MMESWLLILVMMNPTTPHIITIPVSEFKNEINCSVELINMRQENTSSSATLICLQDHFNTTMDND